MKLHEFKIKYVVNKLQSLTSTTMYDDIDVVLDNFLPVYMHYRAHTEFGVSAAGSEI
jgi:hypothetical protein